VRKCVNSAFYGLRSGGWGEVGDRGGEMRGCAARPGEWNSRQRRHPGPPSRTAARHPRDEAKPGGPLQCASPEWNSGATTAPSPCGTAARHPGDRAEFRAYAEFSPPLRSGGGAGGGGRRAGRTPPQPADASSRGVAANTASPRPSPGRFGGRDSAKRRERAPAGRAGRIPQGSRHPAKVRAASSSGAVQKSDIARKSPPHLTNPISPATPA
jgi:hypothetical protein